MIALLLASLSASAVMPSIDEVYKHRMNIVEMGQTDQKESRQFGVIENLIQGQVETSLANLEARGLNSGVVKSQPWSGHYWANYSGGLGMRWSDPNFPSDDWGEGESYVRRNRWNQQYFDALSPAEKYDYLTGVDPTERGSLTSHQWNLGRDEYQRTGTVATWQGICHGWAPASIYLPYPRRDVAFKFPQGNLVLKVDDIKALGSLYYANGTYETLFAGYRCNRDDAPTNSEGRVTDPSCFDVNPGDWHLSLTNLIGARKEPFIIDAAESSEVWNHPVVSYALEYYDPTNINARSTSFRSALRDITRTPNLRHRQFRSAQTRYVVGVVSTILINIETMPGAQGDENQQMTFVYDLELDANLRIIGGEWRDQARPDFIWRPRPGTKPSTPADGIALDMWRMGDANWRRGSLLNSAKGAPLRAFVEELFRLSAQ